MLVDLVPSELVATEDNILRTAQIFLSLPVHTRYDGLVGKGVLGKVSAQAGTGGTIYILGRVEVHA